VPKSFKWSVTKGAFVALACVACTPNIATAQTWTQTTLSNTISVRSVMIFKGQLYAASASTGTGGIFRSSNNGASWTTVNPTGLTTQQWATALWVDGNAIYAGYDSFPSGNPQSIYRSTDGINWTGVYAPNAAGSSSVYQFASKPGWIFAATYLGVLRSPTGLPGSWTLSTAGLPQYFPDTRSIASDGAAIYASHHPTGIYRSTDNGLTWSAFGLVGQSVSGLWYDGSNMFAAASGGPIYKLSGTTWSPAATGLAASTGGGALFGYGSQLYFSGRSGGAQVNLSSNAGTSWIGYNNGLPVARSVMAFAYDGCTLFAGTDQSVWKIVPNPAAC
jgi:hypothetical protein